MVLDNVGKPTVDDGSFTDSSAPSSDGDAYSMSSSGIDTQHLPPNIVSFNPPGTTPVLLDLSKPAPFGIVHPGMHRQVSAIAKATTDLLGRPATQGEAEAILEYHTKLRTWTFGTECVTDAAALTFAVTTSPTYGFPPPFMGRKINPDKFPGLPFAPRQARIAWHGMRLAAWLLVSRVVSTAAVTTLATVSLTPAYMRDPRMKDILAAMKKKWQEGRNALPRQPADQTPGPRAGETLEMARQRARVQDWGRRDKEEQDAQSQGGAYPTSSARRSNATNDDDMSPTGGAFARESLYGNTSTRSGDEMMSDADAKRQQTTTSASSQSFSAAEEQSSTQVDRVRAQSHQDPRSSDRSPSQPLSAWDKLRQKALSGGSGGDAGGSDRSGSAARVDSRQGSAGGSMLDDYSFSSSEEDRHLAKAEAQRDFDAKLEREREGRDFDDRSGSSGSRRW